MLQTPSDFIAHIESPPDAPKRTWVFRGAEMLFHETDGSAVLANDAQLEAAIAHITVGEWRGEWIEALALPLDAAPPPGAVFKNVRSTFQRWPEAEISLAGRANQLLEWARTHRYCGQCGSNKERLAGERAMRCPSCGHSAYPRIAPAMMVLIHRGQELLLARNVSFPVGRYSALAGFLEAGESIDECIHREVMEEVGLKVTNLRYVASQSWPFPHSLMIAFHADYVSGEIVTQPDEIADAQWYGPQAELPQLPPPLSIAAYLIEDGLRMKHPNRYL
jgi:NAD+ diphosphatase